MRDNPEIEQQQHTIRNKALWREKADDPRANRQSQVGGKCLFGLELVGELLKPFDPSNFGHLRCKPHHLILSKFSPAVH